MANNKGQKISATVWAMVGVVVVVLALGIYAVSGTFAEVIEKNKSEKAAERLMAGNGTVSDMANIMGMSADEYLAQYNIVAEDNISGDSKLTDLEAVLTVSEYCEYAGLTYTEEDFAAYKAEKELGEDVTADSTDMEVKNGFAAYMYDKQQAEAQAAEEATESAE